VNSRISERAPEDMCRDGRAHERTKELPGAVKTAYPAAQAFLIVKKQA
jgi:hypothetical protein